MQRENADAKKKCQHNSATHMNAHTHTHTHEALSTKEAAVEHTVGHLLAKTLFHLPTTHSRD